MTGLPNLPTDNLYKLLFLGGLALIIYSSFLYFNQRESIKIESNRIELDTVKINTENDIIKQDLKDIDEIKKELQKDIVNSKTNLKDINLIWSDIDVKLLNKNYREYYSFYYSHKNDLFPILTKKALLQTEFEKYCDKENELKISSLILLKKEEQLIRENSNLKDLKFVVSLLIICGFIFTLLGLLNWYKYQRLADKEMDERYKRVKDKLIIRGFRSGSSQNN